MLGEQIDGKFIPTYVQYTVDSYVLYIFDN